MKGDQSSKTTISLSFNPFHKSKFDTKFQNYFIDVLALKSQNTIRNIKI